MSMETVCSMFIDDDRFSLMDAKPKPGRFASSLALSCDTSRRTFLHQFNALLEEWTRSDARAHGLDVLTARVPRQFRGAHAMLQAMTHLAQNKGVKIENRTKYYISAGAKDLPVRRLRLVLEHCELLPKPRNAWGAVA